MDPSGQISPPCGTLSAAAATLSVMPKKGKQCRRLVQCKRPQAIRTILCESNAPALCQTPRDASPVLPRNSATNAMVEIVLPISIGDYRLS